MEKIFAYGNPEEEERKRQRQLEAAKNIRGYPEENNASDKLLPDSSKVELDVTEIPLSAGTLKIGVKLEQPQNEAKKDKKTGVSLKLSQLERKAFKQKAEAALGKAEVPSIQFSPDLELKVGLDLFTIDSGGNFDMLKTSITMPVRILSKEQARNTPLSDIAAKMSDKAELHVEIKLEIDLSPKEASALKELRLKHAEVDNVGDKVTSIDKQVKELGEKELKNQSDFYDAKLQKLGKSSKDELTSAELKKLEKQFNKISRELQDKIIDAKSKLKKQKQKLKRLRKSVTELSEQIKSPFLKKLNKKLLKKIGTILARIAKALDYIEIVYSALKILILLWSGAKLKILRGKSLSDINLNDMSELLIQTMLDKFTGKEIPEGEETTTERPEAVYPGKDSEDEEGGLTEIQAEYQNFVNLYRKMIETGNKPNPGNETSENNKEITGNSSSGTQHEDKEGKEEDAEAGGASFDGRENTEAEVLEENDEKVEVRKIKITQTIRDEEFGGAKRKIGNERIVLNKSSITHGDHVTFMFRFSAYFKGELCDFTIEKVNAKVHITKPKQYEPQQICLIVTESITCYFKGGRICLKKGSSINYTNIQNK